MSRERWGTFSVSDHMRSAAFVSDVFFYDRLIIPYPPSEDERVRWVRNGWDLDRLDTYLELLNDRAITVPWNEHNQELFKSRYKEAVDVNFDAKNLAEAKANNWDPYHITRLVLQQDSLPQLPTGVSMVRAVAAYPSATSFKQDFSLDFKQTRREKLAIILAHEFLHPKRAGRSDYDMLKEAVQFSSSAELTEARRNLNEWQEDVLEKGITDKKAIEEMKEYMEKYK